MKATITVLQDDIDNGVRQDPNRCPIARAVCRDLNVDHAQVFLGVLQTFAGDWLTGGPWSVSQLPSEAVEFYNHFDRDDQVEPFKFEVEVGGELL